MHPRGNDDGLFLHLVAGSLWQSFISWLLKFCSRLLSNGEDFAVDPPKCLAECGALNVTGTPLISFKLHDVVRQVRIRVGVAVREEYCVLIVLKLIGECQRMVVLCKIKVLSYLILKVADV